MIGEDFHYNNFWLSDYGMKMYDPEETQQFIGREIDKSGLSPLRKVPNHYSVHYSNVLTLSFLILKDTHTCMSQEDYQLNGEEIHTIRSWLESPDTPAPLFVLPYDGGSDVYYFGIFTDIQPFIVAHECCGLYLTFTCNAPFGFSSVISSTYKINSFVGDITGSFHNASAEQQDYLKPEIRIFSEDTFDGTEKIVIKNITDNNQSMALTMPRGASALLLDCRRQRITDENHRLIAMSDVGIAMPDMTADSYVSAELYTFYWLRFVHGNNRLVFSMPNPNTISKIQINARYIIKSGGF